MTTFDNNISGEKSKQLHVLVLEHLINAKNTAVLFCYDILTCICRPWNLTLYFQDEPIYFTFGSYSGMVDNDIYGGQVVQIVNITCNEISDDGVTQTIINQFSALWV